MSQIRYKFPFFIIDLHSKAYRIRKIAFSYLCVNTENLALLIEIISHLKGIYGIQMQRFTKYETEPRFIQEAQMICKKRKRMYRKSFRIKQNLLLNFCTFMRNGKNTFLKYQYRFHLLYNVRISTSIRRVLFKPVDLSKSKQLRKKSYWYTLGSIQKCI